MDELLDELRRAGVDEEGVTDVTVLLQAVALIKRLVDEKAELEDRVVLAERLKDEAESDRLVLENKLLGRDRDASDAVAVTSAVELELQRQAAEMEVLRREHKLMARDRIELEQKLADEIASWERAKADWADREAWYQASLREQAVANRELKTESEVNDREKTQNLEDHQAASVLALQTIIAERGRVIVDLQRQAKDLNLVNFDLGSRMREATARISSLNSENMELREHNQTLMEDQDSYQILLRERTLTGEFMNSAVMHSLEPSVGRSSLSDELGGIRPTIVVESAAWDGATSVQKKDDEIKALTLYISKIISRVLNDDELEARLVNERISVTNHGRRKQQLSAADPSASARVSSRAASPNRHRSGLRAVSPARTTVRPAVVGPKRNRPLLSVVTSEGPSTAGPLSAPPLRRGIDVNRVPLPSAEPSIGARLDDAVNKTRGSSDSTRSGGRSSDEYVAPTPKVTNDGGLLTGFVRRISNAFSSLTSPFPADDGSKKELPNMDSIAEKTEDKMEETAPTPQAL